MDPRQDRLAKEWMMCTLAIGFIALLACTASNATVHFHNFRAVRADIDTELALLPFSCNATNLKRAVANAVERGPVPVKWQAQIEARIERFEIMFNHLVKFGNDSAVDVTKALDLWPCLRAVQEKNLN